MRRFIPVFMLALLAVSAHADTLAQYGVQTVVPFELYNADGTLDVDEVDGGTEVSVRCQGGTNATATNDFVDRGSDYEITLTATEMQCATVIVTVAATNTSTVRITTVNHASAAIPMLDADVREYGGTAGTFASGRPEVNTTHWHGSDLLTGTGPLAGLGVLDRGTAQADSTTSLQLRSALTYADDELNGATALYYSATTGAGQRSAISDYVGSTDTATLATTLPTDPTGTVRYEVYGTASASGSVTLGTDALDSTSLAASAATEIATALQTQALNTGTAGSVGERLGRIPNAAAGGNGGLPTVNASNYVAGVQVLDEDLTTIDLNATPTGAAASVTGAVASVAGNVGGNVVGSVGSVSGNVGGNVVGSVASVVNLEQHARVDARILNCEVNTANFAGSTTTVACILTDRDAAAVSKDSNDLEGKYFEVLSGAQIDEGRYITDSTWDGVNSELQLTLSRALPGTLADAVTAIIR